MGLKQSHGEDQENKANIKEKAWGSGGSLSRGQRAPTVLSTGYLLFVNNWS